MDTIILAVGVGILIGGFGLWSITIAIDKLNALRREVNYLQDKQRQCIKDYREWQEFEKWRDVANNVIIPLELAENFLQSTEVPRFKRILEAAIYRTKR